MHNPGSVALATLLLAGCTTVVLPESSGSSTGSGGSPASATPCTAAFSISAPADSGNPHGEGGDGPGDVGPYVGTWVTGFGFGATTITDVAVDGAGDMLVVGSFFHEIDFGSGITLADPATGGFVAKLDASGHALWANEVADTVTHVFADQVGDVWITDDSVGPNLTRLDPQGNLLWANAVLTPGDTLRVVPTGDGGAIVCGTRQSSEKFMKIDAAGNTVWTRLLNGFFWVEPATSALDSWYETVVDVAAAPGGGAVMLVSGFDEVFSKGGPDGCTGSMSLLLRLDAQGNVMWQEPLASPVSAVAVDTLGNVLVEESALTDDTSDLGHGKFPGGIGLAMFDPTGEPRWGQSFAGSANALRPLFDAEGNILMAGTFYEDIDFGGGTLQGDTATTRLFLVELSPHGQHLTSRTFPTTAGWSYANDGADAMALAPDGAVLLVADYTGTLDLGTGALPSPLSEADGVTNPSGVLARLSH